MEKNWVDYYKVLDTISSCKTIEHLKGAARMLIFWSESHLDDEVYELTFRVEIFNKFKELNGEEFGKIPYKKV